MILTPSTNRKKFILNSKKLFEGFFFTYTYKISSGWFSTKFLKFFRNKNQIIKLLGYFCFYSHRNYCIFSSNSQRFPVISIEIPEITHLGFADVWKLMCHWHTKLFQFSLFLFLSHINICTNPLTKSPNYTFSLHNDPSLVICTLGRLAAWNHGNMRFSHANDTFILLSTPFSAFWSFYKFPEKKPCFAFQWSEKDHLLKLKCLKWV